jgi:putative flippase GtrA
MLKFTKRDILFVLILGELVALFAYAILREQAQAEGASTLIRGVAELSYILPLLAGLVPVAALAALILTYLLGKRTNPAFFQFGKFAAVGFSNTAINWGVINVVSDPETLAPSAYAAVVALAFVIATANSFLWNKFWSFEKKETTGMSREALVFYVITGGGLLINTLVATGVRALGPDTALWAGIIAPAAATATTMFWNFFGYKLVVFKSASTPPQTPNA